MKHKKTTLDKVDTIMEFIVIGFLSIVLVVTLFGTI